MTKKPRRLAIWLVSFADSCREMNNFCGIALHRSQLPAWSSHWTLVNRCSLSRSVWRPSLTLRKRRDSTLIRQSMLKLVELKSQSKRTDKSKEFLSKCGTEQWNKSAKYHDLEMSSQSIRTCFSTYLRVKRHLERWSKLIQRSNHNTSRFLSRQQSD